jgi:hypothetical protein
MKIEGDCSAIYDNTLYVYSPGGFASIPLKENGNWTTTLPEPKYKVTSPACVKGKIYGSKDEALYLVGGTGPSGNSGLQWFSFSSKKWETLSTAPTAMTNRTGHGAGFLSSTSQILVYAGNTDGSTGASQSVFLISTETYIVTSGVDQGAPALYEPIILPWSDSQVALLGGSTTNTAIFVYEATNNKGWTVSEATLPSPIESTSLCALVSEDDNMVLEEFKMDSSPNTVTSYLLKSKGKLQSPATVIKSSGKRSITDSYNSTFAPKESWSQYALAQGNGMVVLSNGQSNDSLAIFNQTSNGWVNSTALFYGSDQNTLKPSTTSLTATSTPTSTSSTSTSATTTPTPTSTPAVAAGGGLSNHGKTILGATLGSVLGFGLILLLILLLLRREKNKKRQAAQTETRGDSKDRLSFQDQGIEPLTEGAYPMARSPVPLAASASADSLAIMTGKYSGEKSLKPPGATGYGLAGGKSSPLSTIPSSGALGASSVYTEDTDKANDSTGRVNQPGNRTTDEGWGKYFEENGGTNLQSDRSTMSSVYTASDYRGSGWPMANMAPLNFGFLDQPKPLGQVFSGSPTTEVSSSDMGSRSLVIPEGQSARISSVDSISVTSDDDRDDPNWQGAAHSSWLSRPTSSNYSTSFYNSSTRDVAGMSANTALADRVRQSNRRSSVIIPDNIDEHELPMQGHKNNISSDMSWLNLKAER